MLALLFVVLFISSWRWLQARSLLPNMVVVDAGSYSIGYNEIGALERSVTIPAPFAIDRTEVTNRSYQICYEQGACLAPLAPNTPTRTAYFLHRAYEQYPVVYVDWRRANQFCAWADKRLPTEDEWEVAAGAAPVTNRHFLYPWGERFNQLYANSARSGIKDTQQVGLYHPGGSSPIGAMDMAGNVAEWTFTVRPQDASNTYVVKGGSYVDEPEMLLVSNSSLRSADFTAPWLGFRCARTLAQPPE